MPRSNLAVRKTLRPRTRLPSRSMTPQNSRTQQRSTPHLDPVSAVPPVPVLPPPLVRVLHRGQIGSARSEYRGWAVLFALGPLSLSFHCDEFNFPVFPHGRPPPTHGEIVQGAVEECGVVHTLKKNI